MKIELFLRDVMQEYPDGSKVPQAKWPYDKWNQWPKDWPYVRSSAQGMGVLCPAPKPKVRSKKILCLKIRTEEFGSLLLDPFTSAVFKLDREATKVIALMRSGYDVPAICKRLSLKKRVARVFISKLKRYELW